MHVFDKQLRLGMRLLTGLGQEGYTLVGDDIHCIENKYQAMLALQWTAGRRINSIFSGQHLSFRFTSCPDLRPTRSDPHVGYNHTQD